MKTSRILLTTCSNIALLVVVVALLHSPDDTSEQVAVLQPSTSLEATALPVFPEATEEAVESLLLAPGRHLDPGPRSRPVTPRQLDERTSRVEEVPELAEMETVDIVPPIPMRVIAEVATPAVLDAEGGYIVKFSESANSDPIEGEDVQAWPLFGNEYRVADFPGYCQVVAFSKDHGLLWPPALSDTVSTDAPDLQAVQLRLSDPMARAGNLPSGLGSNAVDSWVVCMERTLDDGAFPFVEAAALARLDGVSLGEPSRVYFKKD